MLINIYKISYVTNVIGKPSVRTSANEKNRWKKPSPNTKKNYRNWRKVVKRFCERPKKMRKNCYRNQMPELKIPSVSSRKHKPIKNVHNRHVRN